MHEIKLKTAKTTTLNFLIGKTEINYALGKLRNALQYITKDELRALFSNIENMSMYAPTLSIQEKRTKIKLLKNALGLD